MNKRITYVLYHAAHPLPLSTTHTRASLCNLLNQNPSNHASQPKQINPPKKREKNLARCSDAQTPHIPRHLRAPQHVRPAEELHHEPGLEVPGNVAVEGPQAGVVGDKPDQCPSVRLHGEGVAAEGGGGGCRGGVESVVVRSPVEGAGAGLEDPLR